MEKMIIIGLAIFLGALLTDSRTFPNEKGPRGKVLTNAEHNIYFDNSGGAIQHERPVSSAIPRNR